MKSIKLIAAAAALTISSVAVAGPSYTYIDGGIVLGASSGDDKETQGLALRGSFGFANIWHIGAGIAGGESNGGKSKLVGADFSSANLYVGLNPAMTENLDLVIRLGIAGGEQKFDAARELGPGTTLTKDEFAELYLEAGPRGMIGEKFEWSVLATVAGGENKVTGTLVGFPQETKSDYRAVSARAGAAYYFTPNMSLGLDVVIAGDNQRSVTNNGMPYQREGVADLYFRYSF